MKIGVIGVGGVGGYFGGKLSLAAGKDHEVYFIARGKHLDAIKAHGLTLDTEDGIEVCHPGLATDDIAGLPHLDLCLICVKGYDLPAILPRLKHKIGRDTIVLPLLNGVDIQERIRAGDGIVNAGGITEGIVLPSCVYVGTHIEGPGRVQQRGGSRIIHYGPDPAKGPPPAALSEHLASAGIQFAHHENPYPEIWGKFTFIAAFGMVTARSGKGIGEVLADPALRAETEAIMAEVEAIARARGIALPETIVADSIAKGGKFPFETKTSFQCDFERRDKGDERDLFGGTIMRLGKEAGIATPATLTAMEGLEEEKPTRA